MRSRTNDFLSVRQITKKDFYAACLDTVVVIQAEPCSAANTPAALLPSEVFLQKHSGNGTARL